MPHTPPPNFRVRPWWTVLFWNPFRLGDIVPALWEKDTLVAATLVLDHECPDLDMEGK